MYLSFLILSCVSLVLSAQFRFGLPTPADAITARKYLTDLIVAEESNIPPYKREYFKTWIIINGTCDTRETVLKRDGTDVIVTSSCKVLSGNWISPYDGVPTTLPSDLDIDHVVPLKEAWVSGARGWTADKRKAFANDVILPQLVSVTDNLNQAKGDQDPAEWMPPLADFHCTYICAWITVKYRYSLSIDPREKAALANYLAIC